MTLYCSPFNGARVYSRGFYQQIVHHTEWTPDATYRPHDKLANAWVHPDHEGMVLWMPRARGRPWSSVCPQVVR